VHDEAKIKSNHIILSHWNRELQRFQEKWRGKHPRFLTESTYYSGGILVGSKNFVIKNDPNFTILI